MPPDLLTVANGAVQSEASTNGIVLERVGGVVTMCDRPPPGGEPLWRVSRRPRTFVFTAGNSVWGFGICRSVTLAEMGQILAVPDLLGRASVVSALNLDGGSSTQFWARSGDDVTSSSTLAVVANYLLLVHRAK